MFTSSVRIRDAPTNFSGRWSGRLPLFSFFAPKPTTNTPRLLAPAAAVFLYGNSEGTPLALLHNLKHNKVLHKRIVILTVVTDEIPHVHYTRRFQVEELVDGFFRVVAHYGFMEDPNIPELLASCKECGLDVPPQQTTYFLS